MTTVHKVTVVEDKENSGELLLDLGLDLCTQLGWQVGDILEWIDNKDGSWTLQKKATMQP
jgi:DNA-binding Xre family transcriptional regulator